MDLPILAIDNLYHVGTLDPSRRGIHYSTSQEGANLSVSLCPDAWTRIASLDGETLCLVSVDTEFLDILGIGETEMREILCWAEEAGLVELATRFRAWEYDSEGEEWRYSTHASAVLAEEEIRAASMIADDEPLSTSHAGVRRPRTIKNLVEEVRIPILTAAGLARNGGHGEGDDASEAAATFYAEDVLMAERPSIVGVWWREAFDPDRLSAPRGAIFPSRLDQFTVSDEKSRDDDEYLLDEEMPDPFTVTFTGLPAVARP